MVVFILQMVIIMVCFQEAQGELLNYVHLHTQEELVDTNYVLLDKPTLWEDSCCAIDNILVAIKTTPSNRLQRKARRVTWVLELVKHSIPYLFVLGSSSNGTVVQELLAEDRLH